MGVMEDLPRVLMKGDPRLRGDDNEGCAGMTRMARRDVTQRGKAAIRGRPPPLDNFRTWNYIFAHEQILWTEHRSSGNGSKPGSSPSYCGAVQGNRRPARIKRNPD